MLYVFHGTDTTKVADQAHKLVANLQKKKPDAQIFSFEGGSLSEAELDELIEAQGLFVEKHIVVIKRPFTAAQSRDVVLARLERFKVTQNVVVIIEDKILAEHKKLFTKHAEKIEEHAKVKTLTNEFNVFALADALGERNKQALWVGYVKALRAGLEVESIHGTLHWEVKTMLAVQNSTNPEEAGQKPFTYNKAKRHLVNFTEKELVAKSRSLIDLYHNARRGKGDLQSSLERWILEL